MRRVAWNNRTCSSLTLLKAACKPPCTSNPLGLVRILYIHSGISVLGVDPKPQAKSTPFSLFAEIGQRLQTQPGKLELEREMFPLIPTVLHRDYRRGYSNPYSGLLA